MSVWVLAFATVAAVLTAALSSIFGLAGGTLMFVMLSWMFDAKQAVPLHSGVQLVSNFSRLAAYLRDVQWGMVGLFSILLLPGAWLGGQLYSYFRADILEVLVGLFIIATIFLPQSQKNTKPYTFVLLGFLSSFLGMIVAVTGPLISSFFVINNISRAQMVATKSVCQGLTQVVKVAMFATTIGFDFAEYQWLLLFLSVATVAGTFWGKQLMSKISDASYDRMNNALLGFIAVGMVAKPVFLWVQGWW